MTTKTGSITLRTPVPSGKSYALLSMCPECGSGPLEKCSGAGLGILVNGQTHALRLDTAAKLMQQDLEDYPDPRDRENGRVYTYVPVLAVLEWDIWTYTGPWVDGEFIYRRRDPHRYPVRWVSDHVLDLSDY